MAKNLCIFSYLLPRWTPYELHFLVIHHSTFVVNITSAEKDSIKS
jgi:hypothetical protein